MRARHLLVLGALAFVVAVALALADPAPAPHSWAQVDGHDVGSLTALVVAVLCGRGARLAGRAP